MVITMLITRKLSFIRENILSNDLKYRQGRELDESVRGGGRISIVLREA